MISVDEVLAAAAAYPAAPGCWVGPAAAGLDWRRHLAAAACFGTSYLSSSQSCAGSTGWIASREEGVAAAAEQLLLPPPLLLPLKMMFLSGL